MMNKKGMSIIAAVGIVLMLSVLGLVGLKLLSSVSTSAVDYLRAQKAFYIAEAGMKWYVEQLQNDVDWSNNATSGDRGPKDFAGGSFSINVSGCLIDDIDVTSVGTVTGYQGQSIKRQVTQHIKKRFYMEAFDYALYVGGQIHDQGTDNFVVDGKEKEGATNLPNVDYPYYKSIASSGQDISGSYTFHAGTYSGIWYINGDVYFNSNVILNGTVVTTGQIFMDNKSYITVNATQPYPALVSEGNFHFQDASHITVNGLIYVGADMTANFLMQKAEDINFYGTVIVAGNFNLQNSEDVGITYNPDIIDNPPPGFYNGGGANIITITNWHEVY